ncbi:MAG: hypothetical protein SVR04_06305 [Spirochaetota bacterium]|nr:hypothetical protein [Spirochaetota bacterium]
MPDKKIVLWSASFAAVLAFISGLFGRVSFGIVLFRTLLGAAAFGAFAFGTAFLLKQFIPELFDSAVDSATGGQSGKDTEHADTSHSGGNVNIVLEGEEPSFTVEGKEEASGFTQAGDSDNEFIEEIREEDVQEDEGGGQRPTAENAVQASNSAETGDILDDYGDLSDVDTLPDLEEFSDSFESVAASQDDDTFSEKSRSSDNKVDMLEGQHDPATVAKAVRTIIRRDQEG